MHCDDSFARLLLTGLVADNATPAQVMGFRILEVMLETLSKANCDAILMTHQATHQLESYL